jgi:hypothetical protein
LLLDLERACLTALQRQLSAREQKGQGKYGGGVKEKGQDESGGEAVETANVVDEEAAGDVKSACVAALEV